MSGGPFSPSDVIEFKSIDTGGQSAGNGGTGYNSGNISDSSKIVFEPYNYADGSDVHASQSLHGSHDTAAVSADTTAYQTNFLAADMHQSVAAGIGGNGGSHNTAEGGDVSFHLSNSIPTTEVTSLDDVLNNSNHFDVNDFLHV